MWLNEIGSYNYKARMYAPHLGRFLQADPIGYGDGMNMYAYVGGDPVNAEDSDGLQKQPAVVVTGHRKPGIPSSSIQINTSPRYGVSSDYKPAANTADINPCSPVGGADPKGRAKSNALGSRVANLLGLPGYNSPGEMKLLNQYFGGDTTPYRLNSPEWQQAKDYVAAHPDAVGGNPIEGHYTSRQIAFGMYSADASLLDGLLGVATGTFYGDELVGIKDTFNFDFKRRGKNEGGVLANLGVLLVRVDAAFCSGDTKIPVSGGNP
jgi:RHS repeat-associated protein